ncbi:MULTISPECIES: hypothetical protein [unclassified Streptomyces]|uniref:hypothetical protein n=1 Tax=unclassified Streptomyces TaxID=2593676 RepID=UPI00332135E1
MSPSLERTIRAQHFTMLLTLISFLWNLLCSWEGADDVPVTYLALLALACGCSAALAGNGLGSCMTFVFTGALVPLAWWAALLPAAVIVLYRVLRRAARLARGEGGPRPVGFWRTLQAWAGWTLA